MGIILNPDRYPCPDHPAQDLTQQVDGAIYTTPIKIVRFGFRARRFGPGRTVVGVGRGGKSEPFRVVVTCPEGDGHPVTCNGTWRRD